MINKEFWKDAASSWTRMVQSDIHVRIGSGGQISEELLKEPWEIMSDDFVEFDKIDQEATLKSILEGGDVILKERKAEEPLPSVGICFDMDIFDEYLELETFTGFLSCFRMLKDCGLPDEMTSLFGKIVERMTVFEDTANKFTKVYEADMSMFIEYYIPEALNLSVGYIEYVNAKVDEKILISTQNEVVEALDTLLIGINDKIDEIYKFASIEIKAKAKALESMMSQDGHVDSKYKIN